MSVHHKYLQRCIELAQLGAGYVSPNPMVGAVIVHDGDIIGEGYHQKYGGPHAEVNAVNSVLSKYDNAVALLQASTIYVSLEPCAHYGKTPPCADLIIKHRIPTVVVGCRDPFNQVNGKGIEKLQEAGIEVITGVMEQECLDLNRRFFTRVQKQRPYIILKWAQAQDGFFAPDDDSQYWITGPEARKLVHKWRSEEDAVLVGKNTARIDNPQLNIREWEGRSPKRVVIDRRLELSHDLHLFDQSVETFVFNEIKTDIDGRIKYIALEDFDNYVPQYIMFQLYLQDVQSVIIEGGAATLNSFIAAGLWDEARVFTGNKILGNGIQSPLIKGVKYEEYIIGSDQLQIIFNS
ncbi:bifunctional diaminohydroxyphosphoribosylaminopyrimidine deaminase/5-amino-6-(5-phosphoribosylamino)uracil reductase RibD [Mucilaginibacter mali]|uniref:Riboflavin biosynthesis protein RibD n=1 Tax=Mucilaginibacter mali TaxID=2740462 RepID=A0A7D4TWT3_9SPHI|nr:bifunctional diaminohydroxyphosphoribosylaminopyrimidine deaminase/5-amino-6-(5-phosphoribosylamino)uracil reductase RibD [Mucilaginibacter mali]QKJ29817.1 bifunctional diaminohydroxyphosphoribosylaminopyrimidine deaminase/5-amino-6-(5-phosphoribosylamino)uracil reductase RibD [Mucilaginibacter mali]